MIALRPSSVLPDANVWVSTTLHSWFGLIAAEATGTWSFYWTEDILAEAVRGRRRRFPHSSSKQMEDVRDRLMKIFGENRISNFPCDDSVEYPDEFDAHVHSAAVHEGIAIVVTENIKDLEPLYPDPDQRPYDLMTPDEWLVLAAESAPSMIDKVIKLQHDYHAKNSENHNLVAALKGANCPEFAAHVQKRLQYVV